MRNRVVGYIIIGFGAVIGFVIYLFNRALTEIISTSCSHGTTCPMWGSIRFHTNLSTGLMVAVILIGLYFVIFGRDSDGEKNVETKSHGESSTLHYKKLHKDDYAEIMAKVDEDERITLEKIIESQGTIFQSDLVDQTQFGKVKVTRILDKLEGRGLIERKRRGMTNVVILKRN